MILNNFIVEFSEHVSVVVDKFEELSSYSPEIILANGQARGNLKMEKFNVLLQMMIFMVRELLDQENSKYLYKEMLLEWRGGDHWN